MIIRKSAIILLLLAVALTNVFSQTRINEGKVTYTVSYVLPADKQQYANLLPKEVTCYFRGDSTAAIVNQGAATIKGVSVFKNGYHCLIVDIPANSKKIVVVMTAEEVEQEKAGIPQLTFKKGTEKQTINGFNCTKATATDVKTGTGYDIWLTNDIAIPPSSVSRPVSAFGGVPVRFVTFNNNVTINAELKEVKEEPVPAGFFTASKDYESMSYSELKSMSNGN